MTNEQEHQGWTNRETWAASLWINNDQGMQEMGIEYAGQDEYGDALKDWFDELWAEVLDNPAETSRELRSMFGDIGSLWRVNWKEVRDGLLED